MQPPFCCDYGTNSIGGFTLFGPAVQIYTATHPFDAALRRRQEYGAPVEIGAGSVVTHGIPDGMFAAGNPCRVIREARDREASPRSAS